MKNNPDIPTRNPARRRIEQAGGTVPPAAQFCNSEATNGQDALATTTLFGFVNEINIEPDGWAMIAPLGDFPSEALLPTADGRLKRQRAIQRITRQSAEGMVAQFHNERAGIKKFLRGCNIYLGHPDMPGLEARYPDKTPKGVFADMQVRTEGIYGLPVFTNEGMDLVEGRKLVDGQKVRGFSGRLVDAAPDGTADGIPVFTPTRIASAGLTAHPHLPVEFFNADDTLADPASAGGDNKNKKQKPTMNKKLMAVLALLGIKPQFANAEQPTEGETEGALDLAHTRVTALTTQQTSLKSKLPGLCKKVGMEFANEAEITDPAATLAQVEEKVVAIGADLATARAQFANERAARVKDELDHAVTAGRITAAERPVWETRLTTGAQFANELAAIRALAPKVKTTSLTLTRGSRKDTVDLSNPHQKRQFINEVLAEIAAEQKLHPVRHSKQILNLARARHPQLFDAAHVEIRVPGKKT